MQWLPTFGRVLSSEYLRMDRGRYAETMSSKRWVVDRASLKRARADDLLYIGDPELLDFLNIFFANGRLFLSLMTIAHTVS